MKVSILAGLLAPALLSVAAASQTIVAVRPLPFTGVPRILPVPVLHLPMTPVRLPSPMTMPQARLAAPILAPRLRLNAAAVAVAAPAAPAAPALPASVIDAERKLPTLPRPIAPAPRRVEAPSRTKKAPALERLFDGRDLTLPEDDLERELGLR